MPAQRLRHRLAKNDPARIAGLRLGIKVKVLSAWARKLHDSSRSSLDFFKIAGILTAISPILIIECLMDWIIRVTFRVRGVCFLLPWRSHREMVIRAQMHVFYHTRIIDPYRVRDSLSTAAVVFVSTHYHGELDRMAIQYASGFTCATMSVVPGRYAREVEGCTGINQHSKAENVKHFKRIIQLMNKGTHIWIAPEGEINEGTQLKEKLFTGCARIAMDFAKESGNSVKMIPTFINYEREQTFQTQVTISFGTPISVTAAVSSESGREHVREVMSLVDLSMRRSGSVFQCCRMENHGDDRCVSRFVPFGGQGSRLRAVASTLLDLWRMKLVDIGVQRHCGIKSWTERLDVLQLDCWARVSEEAWTKVLEYFFASFGGFINSFAAISGGIVEEASTAFEVGQHIKLFPKLRCATRVHDLERPVLSQAPYCMRSVKLLNVDILRWKRSIQCRRCLPTAKADTREALDKMSMICSVFVQSYVPLNL